MTEGTVTACTLSSVQLHSSLERHRNKIGCARDLSARTAPLKLGEPREMWKEKEKEGWTRQTGTARCFIWNRK